MQQLCCLRDAVYTPVGTYLCSLIHSPYSLNCIILLTHFAESSASTSICSPTLAGTAPSSTRSYSPLASPRGKPGGGLHSRLWDARKLAKRLVPTLGLPPRRPRVRYEAPRRSRLAAKILLIGGNWRRLSVCVADPVLVSGELRRGGARPSRGGAGGVSPRG